MNYKVIPESSAEEELEETFRWIAREAPVAAVNWYNGCIEAMHSLESFPHRCAIAPESEFFGYEIRHLIYGNYRILFTIREDAVHVLHERHGARAYLSPDDSEEQ